MAYSGVSGISLGAYESKSFGYTHIQWMPDFMQSWYLVNNRSEKIFGKFFTWQKIFREIDYITDRQAYQNWLVFFGSKWYFAYISHWIIKNTLATFTRDLYRIDEPFYSFKITLIF